MKTRVPLSGRGPAIRNQKVITAWHEAGHAVIAWWLGVEFKYVTIEADSDSLGHVRFSRRSSITRMVDRVCAHDPARISLDHKVVIGFAGQIAVSKKRGKPQRWGMDSDNQGCVEIAFRLHGSRETAEAYLRYCFFMARDLVSRFWPEIQAIASALTDRGTLSWNEVIEETAPTGMAGLIRSRMAGKFRAIENTGRKVVTGGRL